MSILAIIVLLPLVAALLLCLVPRNYNFVMQAVAWLTTFIVMVLALVLFCHFNSAASVGGYKYAAKIPWLGMESLGIACRLGVDGINVGLILMGAVVAFAAVCVSWSEIKTHQKEFYILLLVMIGGILGAFASLDMFYFYFFHELALVPTFIMIGVWGRGADKNFATFQITMYLSVGALISLVGLIALYLKSGAQTFDMAKLTAYVAAHPLSLHDQNIIFPLLLFGFGILVSLWPFHTWAPLGYGSAPTATAMLHAGVLKKFGLYGLIRLALPLMPQAAHQWTNVIGWLCLGNIFYCGLVAMRQQNLNWLIGYSSVAHMGFVFLGIASLNLIGVTGAVLVMIAHGFLAALIMAMFAGCGLPGFANFAGEITVFFGAWANTALHNITAIAVWGALVIGAVYMLRAVRDVLHGALSEKWLTIRESPYPVRRLPYVILLAFLLVFGFFPGLLANKIKPAAERITLMAAPVAGKAPVTEAAAKNAEHEK